VPDFGIRTAQSEFGKAVEGKKFRHPETGNMVLYTSLPMAEQHRIYEDWKRSEEDGKSPGKSRAKVETKKHWKPVRMDDIYDDDVIVYEHDGETFMGRVVRSQGTKEKATKFWVVPIDPETGRRSSTREFSFDEEKIKERRAKLVPAGDAPGKSAPVLSPEQRKKLEEEAKRKREEEEKREKARKKAVERMGKTGKPVDKVSDLREGDVVAYHSGGEVHHGRVIEAKPHKISVLPIDPETGRILEPVFDELRAHDMRGFDVHRVDDEHAPEDPKKDNILQVLKSLRRLPEDPKLYFRQVPGSKPVDIGQVKPGKVRLRGVMHANDLMEAARKKGLPRDPISLIDNGDGTYTVRDGNSTFTNARLSGWKRIPAVVKTRAEWEEHDRREKEREEKEREEKERAKFVPSFGAVPHITARKAPRERPEGFSGTKARVADLHQGDEIGYRFQGRWYVGRVDKVSDGKVVLDVLHPATGEMVRWDYARLDDKELAESDAVVLADYGFPEIAEASKKKKAAIQEISDIAETVRRAYRSQWQEWPGYKTLVDEKSEKGILPSDTEDDYPGRGQDKLDHIWPVELRQPREKERALPLPSDNDEKREKRIGPTYYNKNRKVPYRTKSEPGEEYGHPTKLDYNYVRRRQDVTAGEDGEREAAGLFPVVHQKSQRGPSRVYYKQWYLRHREPIKRRERVKYRTRLKFDPRDKLRRKYRRLYPLRYKRRGLGPMTPAERSREWRREQALQERRAASHVAGLEALAEAMEILGLDVLAGNWPVDWNTHHKKVEPPEQLDQNYAPSQPRGTVPRKDPEKQKGEPLRAPDLDRKPQKGLQWKIEPAAPGGTYPIREVNNPGSGSGKVIPMWGDFVNNTQQVPDGRQDRYVRNDNFEVKTAYTLPEILDRVDSKIKTRATGLDPRLERTDTKNWIWTWRVGKHVVRVQAFKRGRATNIDKLNLRVSCSCPFWQWWGPEHWAQKANYLRGNPRGTATPPRVRDPAHWRPVCKHAYAVLRRSRDFFVRPEKSPLRRLARFSVDRDERIEVEILSPIPSNVALRVAEREIGRRVLRRYLGEGGD